MISRGDFARAMLKELDAPVEWRNLIAVVSWEQAEGTQAKFNPLATTKKMSGSTVFNWMDVQNYVSLEQGVEATVKTLKDGIPEWGYGPIIRRLKRAARAERTLEAVEESAWGTGGLALRVLPYVRDNYRRYASEPIGQ